MRYKIILPVLFLVISSLHVYAEEGENNLKFNATVRLWAAFDIKDQNSSDNTLGRRFMIDSAFWKAEKKISDHLSVHIRGDAVEDSDSGTKTGTYYFAFKNAYIKGANDLGPANLSFKAGLVETPIIAMVDKVSGYRWLNSNYVNLSKQMFGNQTSISLGDNISDLGIILGADIMKTVEFTYAITNGEGYKDLTEEDTSRGKANYGLLSIKPLKGLLINGFARHEKEEKENTDIASPTVNKSTLYYGGGIGWKSSLIKIGGYYIRGNHKTDGTRDHKYVLMDSWLMSNLNSIAGVPVLIYGRFARGEDKDVDDAKTTLWAAGMGYQFNRFFRIGLYYENFRYVKGTTAPAAVEKDKRTFFIKSEAKF